MTKNIGGRYLEYERRLQEDEKQHDLLYIDDGRMQMKGKFCMENKNVMCRVSGEIWKWRNSKEQRKNENQEYMEVYLKNSKNETAETVLWNFCLNLITSPYPKLPYVYD